MDLVNRPVPNRQALGVLNGRNCLSMAGAKNLVRRTSSESLGLNSDQLEFIDQNDRSTVRVSCESVSGPVELATISRVTTGCMRKRYHISVSPASVAVANGAFDDRASQVQGSSGMDSLEVRQVAAIAFAKEFGAKKNNIILDSAPHPRALPPKVYGLPDGDPFKRFNLKVEGTDTIFTISGNGSRTFSELEYLLDALSGQHEFSFKFFVKGAELKLETFADISVLEMDLKVDYSFEPEDPRTLAWA